jgi:predicted transcriptional regulator
MREAITISLPRDLKDTLDRVADEEGVTRSDIVRESLRNYLFIPELPCAARSDNGSSRNEGRLHG